MKKTNLISKKLVLTLIGIAILMIAFALAITSKQIRLVDDSWITFRVSNNLVHHGELTYNLGDKVEGISNLLWAVALAFIAWILPVKIPVIAVALSLVLVVYAVFRLWRIGSSLGFNPILATFPALFLLFSPDFMGTATNGLEMPLCFVLILESIWFFLKEKYPISFVFLGLLFLTRIETIGIALIFLVILIIKNKSLKKGMLLSSTIIYFGIVLLTTLGRVLYYGDFLPNSVRAKQIPLSSGLLLSGVRYILDFALQNPVYIVIFFGGLILLCIEFLKPSFRDAFNRIKTDKSLQLLFIATCCVLFSFVVTIKNGGDWMPNYRLLILYSGFYACLFFTLMKKGTLSVVISLAILASPFIHTTDQALYRVRHETDFSIADYSAGIDFWSEASEKLAGVVEPSDVVSAEAIGYIGYTLADTTIHDPLGLTDRNIARTGQPAIPFGKTNIEYTVNQIHPAVMIWHYTGHLNDLDLKKLDKEYKTFCFENCESWNAHVVMIRADRVNTLAKPFTKWQVIRLQDLP
jgi:hypothetical protein